MIEEIVLDTDDKAASYQTGIKGWVSRKEHFFGEREDLARYDGSTHRACNTCGAPSKHPYTACEACRDKRAEERYQSYERVKWDGESPVYSEALDRYFESPDQALEEDSLTLESLRLFLCAPNYAPPVDEDRYTQLLPEDEMELPDRLKEAIDQFNQAIEGICLSWHPTKKVIIEDE